MHAVEYCPQLDPDLLVRAQGEYIEMPGLHLTLAQAARLWNVDRGEAARVLETLVGLAFLRRVGDGYVRAGSWGVCV
jgi:hypothetical protein